jgi:tetratricopeptide (TPR) repeat protein
MRLLTLLIFCVFSLQVIAQEPQLAYQYYRNGEYAKAAELYKILQEKNPFNTSYTNYLVDCYQQLEQYETVEKLITMRLEKLQNQDYLYVDLGYNYQLQHLQIQATENYEKALNAIDKNSNLGYLIGKTFQDNHLLDYALLAFQKTMENNPNVNYNFQIALIYGEKAEISNMFNTYLDMVADDEKFIPTSKSYMGRFITDDPENEHNISLKKLLIKRSQNNPQNSWNELLSWLYMQQNEYEKALIQEIALYKRNGEGLQNIQDIGAIAFENQAFESAKNCFHFILENTKQVETELTAKLYLLQINMETNADIDTIEAQFQQLFDQYGINRATLNIQIVYAEFLAFKMNNPEKGIAVLKNALQFQLNEFQEGYVKTKLADIYVFTSQFNTALIYYTQVQNSLKNHEIGQTARFKIAQTSYFKGDFEWSQSQLKVLKNSTSQLISNDALALNLLITDNVVKDSLRVALKKYAIADLLAFQNKNEQAIDTLQVILTNFKGHPIEDETLFEQAQLFEKTDQFYKAEENYLKIISLNKADILADDATYYLAELYLNKLNNTENATKYYQLIIFEYPSSIYLVDARKKYRQLRGDILN